MASPNRPPLGRLNETLGDVAVLAGLRDARIILALYQDNGELIAFFGEVEYQAASGPDRWQDDWKRIDQGASASNPFPPGTYVIGVDPNTDDPERLALVVQFIKGRCDALPQHLFRHGPSSN